MAANGKDQSTSKSTTKDRNYMEASVHNGDEGALSLHRTVFSHQRV